MVYPYIIYLSVDGHLVGFPPSFWLLQTKLLPINISVQIFLWLYMSFSLGYIRRNTLAESYRNCRFNFWRKCQAVLQSGCTILHSYQQYMRVPVTPHPRQNLVWAVFLILAIITGVHWYLIVILICISLKNDDVEHLFMYLFVTHISSLMRCLFKSFAHFEIVLYFLFLVVEFWEFFIYILDTRSLSETCFAKIFSKPVAGLFSLFTVFLKSRSF